MTTTPLPTFASGIINSHSVSRAGAALAAESARFAARGWMPGTAGNLSVTLSHDPVVLAVTASGLDKGELTHADVVVVDVAGERISGAPGAAVRPSAEAGLHARIAAVAGAGAAIHTHVISAVAAGARWPGGVKLRDLEMLKGIGFTAHGETVTIPVVPNSQDMVVLGDDFAAQYRGVPALIVAGHGIYAWGATLTQARWHLEIVDALLNIALTLDAQGTRSPSSV